MKLLRIAARGVAGLPDLDLSLAAGAEPAPVVLIKGPPGSGKSRLLDLIVHAKERIGAYGPLEPDRTFTTAQRPARVELELWLDADEVRRTGAPRQTLTGEVGIPAARGLERPTDPALVDVLSHFDRSPEHPKVEYFRADRAAGQHATTSGDADAEQKRLRLSRSPRKLASLKRLAADALAARAPRGRALADLYREITGSVLVAAPGQALVAVRRSGERVPIAELSASEWDAFVVSASIVMLGLSGSLILFDTPELHLSAEETSRRFALYRRAAPNAQWLVASHDPALAREASVTIDLGGLRA